jgi:hypothetical protein
MANDQAGAPATDKPAAAESPGEGGSLLTGEAAAAEITGAGAVGAKPASEKPAWMAQLPGDLQADESLTKFKTIGDLGKSYRELEGKIGKSVTVPDDKATPEEVAAFRKRIGVPEKPDDYKVEKVELPKGIGYDDARIKEIVSVAHAEGVTPKQFNAVFKAYMSGYAKDMAEATKLVKITQADAERMLKDELKGDYQKTIELKDRAFKEIGGPKLAALMVGTGLGNHPEIIKMFAKIGEKFAEHAFVDGSRGARTETGTFGNRSDTELAAALYPDKK